MNEAELLWLLIFRALQLKSGGIYPADLLGTESRALAALTHCCEVIQSPNPESFLVFCTNASHSPKLR